MQNNYNIIFNSDLSDFFGKYTNFINNENRYLVLKGGSGSGKSHFAAQKILYRCLNESDGQHRFLIIRKTQPSLKKSCFNLIADKINDWGVSQLFNIREYDMHIDCVNGNEILFVGLDDPEKLKSIERITSIWMEEATELKKTDFIQVDLRLRGEFKYYKQIMLSFNPVDENSWLNDMFFKKNKEGALIHESTVDDNIFADPDYVKILDSLADEDENYYNIYRLGRWGVLKGLIYSKYKILRENEWPDSFSQTVYGLDFGYNNPSVLVEVNEKDENYYIREILYQPKLTNADLIKKLNELVPNKKKHIYGDSAEPGRIEEIKRAGFNIWPSNKVVKDGIDFCKSKQLYLHGDSINAKKEIQSYKYKETKDGITLEEPLKFNDHFCDAMRYAMFTHFGKPKRIKQFGGGFESREQL